MQSRRPTMMLTPSINISSDRTGDRLERSRFSRADPKVVERTTLAALWRSEKHTSELQSPDHLVCRLLLEKKKSAHSQREHTQFSASVVSALGPFVSHTDSRLSVT